jgi:hypothetical protein
VCRVEMNVANLYRFFWLAVPRWRWPYSCTVLSLSPVLLRSSQRTSSITVSSTPGEIKLMVSSQPATENVLFSTVHLLHTLPRSSQNIFSPSRGSEKRTQITQDRKTKNLPSFLLPPEESSRERVFCAT